MKQGTLRSPIPKAIRDELATDPFMRSCIVADGCEGRVEFDHAFSYAGRRVNALWAILPLCSKHNHAVTSKVQSARRKYLRARIMEFGALQEFKCDYPKSDLFSHVSNAVEVERDKNTVE